MRQGSRQKYTRPKCPISLVGSCFAPLKLLVNDGFFFCHTAKSVALFV